MGRDIKTFTDAFLALGDMHVALLGARSHALNLDDWNTHLLAGDAGDEANSLIDQTDAYVTGLQATIPVGPRGDDLLSSDSQWLKRIQTAQSQTQDTIKTVTGVDADLAYTWSDLVSDSANNVASTVKTVVDKVTSIIPWQVWALLIFAIVVFMFVRFKK